MKRLPILLMILLSLFSNAQLKYAIFEYNEVRQSKATPNMTNGFLIIPSNESNTSHYMTYGSANKQISFDEIIKDLKINLIGGLFLIQKNEYWVKTSLPIENTTLIRDEKPNFKWKILKEKKEILGYDCTKAIGDFRGRNYTVWFTKELPFQLGPWKLSGLPGMILEAEDDYNLGRTYLIKKIELNKELEFPKPLTQYFESLKNEKTSFKELIDLENTFLKELRQQIATLVPIGSKTIKTTESDFVRGGEKELQFEWETAPAKF